MPVQRLKDFLDEKHIKYVSLKHSPAYTAADTAHAAHIPGKIMVKTVVVRLDGKPAMLVLPSNYKVYPDLLKRELGVDDAALVPEDEFRELFPGCDVGAMPPFGHLYGLRTYADQCLAEDDEIAFNAGSHVELIRLSWSDFQRLERPEIRTFALKNITHNHE